MNRPPVTAGQAIRVLTTQGEGVVRRIHRDGRPIATFVSYLDGERGSTTIEVDAPYEVIEGPPKPWIVKGQGETFHAGPGETP